MQLVWNLAEAVNLAQRVEEQINRSKTNTFQRPPNQLSIEWSKSTLALSYPPNASPSTPTLPQPTKGRWLRQQQQIPYAKPLPPECYRCQQLGHRSNECPQWRQLGYAGENEEVVKEFGECGDEFVDANVVHGNEGEAIVCILQKLLFAPRQAQLTLRNAIY